MPDIESSSSSYSGPEDPQWLLLVTLFLASLGTLGLYLLQYFQQRAAGLEPRSQDRGADKEAASLLGWALSRKSWKSKWREAWCGALSAESRKLGVSPGTAAGSCSAMRTGSGAAQQPPHRRLKPPSLPAKFCCTNCIFP